MIAITWTSGLEYRQIMLEIFHLQSLVSRRLTQDFLLAYKLMYNLIKGISICFISASCFVRFCSPLFHAVDTSGYRTLGLLYSPIILYY